MQAPERRATTEDDPTRTIARATITFWLAAGSALAAPAGRTVERAYEPAEVDASLPRGSVHNSSSVTFRSRSQERFVTVAIRDDSGLTVPGRVTQDVDGDGEAETTHEFCSATSRAVPLEPGVPVDVVMLSGSCQDPSTNPAEYRSSTAGTVTATFTR